jgi:serine acetyltransferase
MRNLRHPINPHIVNGRIGELLIFATRTNVPLLRRLIMLPLGCDIGARLPKQTFLPHPYGIVIRASTVLGEMIVIGHQVTLGGDDFEGSAPSVDDGVYIGAGAKILGGVKIGRFSLIGANAVVTRDVPEGAVVVGANRILDKRSPYIPPVNRG